LYAHICIHVLIPQKIPSDIRQTTISVKPNDAARLLTYIFV
jgi:hypothetical protein